MTERKTETPSKGILKCTLNLLICYFYILSGITGIIGIIGKIGINGIIGIIIPDRYKSFLPPLGNCRCGEFFTFFPEISKKL